jgi:uncharacterized protein
MDEKHDDNLILFFLLAFIISWVFWLPLIYAHPETGMIALLPLFIGGLGPLIASIVVSRRMGTYQQLKSAILKWKVSSWWYAVAVALPLLILVLSYFPFLALGGSIMDVSYSVPWFMYPLLLLYVMIVGGGLEEPGWRGLALPLLLKRHNPFTASIIIGMVWALWHIPLFLSPITSQYGIHFGWFFLNTIGLSIIFTWLFIKSGMSVFIAIILHGGINAALSYYPGMGIGMPLSTVPFFAPIAIATWAVAIIMIIVDRDMFMT